MSIRIQVSTVAAVALASILVLPQPVRGTPAAFAGTVSISSLPYTISSPGRYIVTASLTGLAGSNGVTVSSSDVTLDLCGYTLFGVAGSLAGVRVDTGFERVHVLNGGVRGWDSGGVIANLAAECAFEDLFLADNGSHGLRAGADARIVGVIAHDNSGDGIDGTGCVLESIARGNLSFGIDFGGLVARSTATDNGGDGVNVGGDSQVETCLSVGNLGDGFSTGAGVTFSACLARDNGEHGFVGTSRSRVAECLSVKSGEHGFSFTEQALLCRNLAADNGQLVGTSAGISISGSFNRLDENEVHGNPTGIEVTGTDNAILRNSASDNTTAYTVAAGNYFFVGLPTAVNGWINLSH